jgi:cation transport regulator ChaB
MKDPPEWMKGLPEGAQRIGIEVFNRVYAKEEDDVRGLSREEKARRSCWSAIKARYEKNEAGEWREMEAPAAQSAAALEMDFRAAQRGDASGLLWEAVLIQPGLTLTNFYFPEEVLEASAPRFKGADIFAFEIGDSAYHHVSEEMYGAKRYLVRQKVGSVEDTRFQAGVGIVGRIRLLDGARWLADSLSQGIKAGADVLGLSIDTRVKASIVEAEGQKVAYVREITDISSVDVVTRPAAGGRFLRAVAGLDNQPKEGKAMDREKLLSLIHELRPDLLQGKDRAKLTDDEVLVMARMAMTPDPDVQKRAAQAVTQDQMAEEIRKATQATEQRAACGRVLDATLAESQLPAVTAARIRKGFEGKVFEKAALDADIKAAKDEIAALAQMAQEPVWGDQRRIAGGLGSRDKIEMAADLLFGLVPKDVPAICAMARMEGRLVPMRAAQDYDGVPKLGGIRELYTLLTGDPDVSGVFNRAGLPAELRAAQEITSATFTFVVGNTMARRLVSDYMAADYGEDLLISVRKPVADFRQQEAVMVGYFPDLSQNDPELANWPEIQPVTDEESTYTVLQFGNILTITRRMIINDDISVVLRIVTRLGRAARRTHAKYVWNFFVANANCSDGTAWFTGPHGNLGAVALSHANAQTAYIALAQMTEKDSGERLNWLDDPSVRPTLVYPVALINLGNRIVNEADYFTGNDLTTKTPNPLHGKINGRQLSHLADPTDWGLLMPPTVADMVEMGYLQGRTEPEMFIADMPQSEQVFVADRIRHKIRHEYAGAVVDFRSGYKSVAA